MSNTFTQRDIEQIEAHGSTTDDVNAQICNFRRGFGYLPIRRAAVAGDGIVSISAVEADRFAERYDKAADDLRIVKFIPASGAATRMFKSLFELVNEGRHSAGADKVVAGADKLAFWPLIVANAANAAEGDPQSIAKAILNYGAELPKALILFHGYPDRARTALEEHLAEGAMYAAAAGKATIHLTISPEHKAGFDKLLSQTVAAYENRFGVKFDITTSQQQSSTDTIAVTPDNEPFRDDDGSLVFRPAGHGALIHNLNDIDADVIFIKTVDNVVPDHAKADTILYKKAIAGILLDRQAKTFDLLRRLDEGADNRLLDEIKRFAEDELSYRLPSGFTRASDEEKIAVLRKVLDRPIRVCGMVRNEGEPGGGPFWVENPDGSTALQIGESAQVDPAQMEIMRNGTHFNPVDIVCGVMDYRGRKFDLLKFIDPSTGFISEKSKNGRPLKAQELPGLWNGAMADWNTIFVEVPISTFSPVKEVADLLRPQHQPQA